MLSIGRLKIRNFKSFRFIDIPLSSNFIALAGPNGSGKSNVVDSVRFALGEISLRSLRARRVRDLIFAGSESGEVTLYFNGDEKYEIHRAIRKDGKIRYRLNGKNTTRQSILETLKHYHLDRSGRNIIAQGEVQGIVQMSGKERRAILDNVAGISDFEEKKKEAIKELDIVSSRIKDARLVMGERLAYLKELGQERENALRFQKERKQVEQARASLLHLEVEAHEKNLSDAVQQYENLYGNFTARQKEMAELERTIAKFEEQRSQISQELQARQKTAGLIQTIETLRASIGSKSQSIEDSQVRLREIREEDSTLRKELTQEAHDTHQLEKTIREVQQQLQQKEAQSRPLSDSSSASLDALETQLQKLHAQLQAVREQRITRETEIASKQEILRMKESELQSVEENLSSVSPSDELQASKKELQQKVRQLEKQLDDSFTQMKEQNVELARLDTNLLEKKEKLSILRMRASPALLNPALQYLQRTKRKGVYGTVAELIQFDPKYASAVEAAAGGRLLYVVVEDARLAMQLINELKSQREGRVTFIPLKDVRSVPSPAVQGYPPVSQCLEYSPKVKSAIDFVFGSTLLANTMEEARNLARHGRAVTLAGEIFEPSGIITGGKVKTSLLAASRLKALEQEAESLGEQKRALFRELEALRESESRLRSQKAEAEVHIKTVEMQLGQRQAEAEQVKKTEEKKDTLRSEIRSIQSLLQNMTQEKEKLDKDHVALEKKEEAQRSALQESKQTLQEQQGATQRRREEWVGEVSRLKATLGGKQNELQLRKESIHQKNQRQKALDGETKNLQEKIRTLKGEVARQGRELVEAEEKIQHKSKQIEKLFEQIKGLENDIQKEGEQRGRKKLEMERLGRDINELKVRRATLETRLEDLNREFEPYKKAERLSLPKEKLSSLLEEAEAALKGLGDVNISAIELYEKKKEEMDGLEEKLEKLSEERKAVLQMMDEIETHKKDAFFETFEAVADNFRKIFKHINIGQGILYLDKPNDPFESGLTIKLRRGNKEYSLDSLSGGENSLIALMFIFAIQFFRPSPFYILDEVDAALDKENSKNLAQLIHGMSGNTQFLVVTHNDILMGNADAVLGVAKTQGVSRLVGVKLEQRPG
ncbi:MAG TPA: chromosome segregation SMC family protein [Candidatus Bilamarchaeaceae archaeon]|nr:chromosome segregation SMC family protein [Candidatus Bilamarchaeaceae archaeon]